MRDEIFERMPVARAVILLGLPTMAGMLLTVLYNMVDMVLVGMTDDAQQLASIALLAPLSMVSMSIGSVFGIGGASCISRQLGRKSRQDAARTCSFCFYAVLVLSLLYTGAALLLLPVLLPALGAGGTIMPLATDYGRLLLLGAVPAALTFSLNQLVRARGLARESMIGMVLGAAVNLAVDPLFILTLHMGVVGSAAASLTADLFSCAYFISLIVRDDVLSLRLRHLRPSRCIVSQILSIGAPTCVTHFILCGSGILFNRLAVQYGDHVIAAFGVASRVLMLPVMASMGLAKGAQPLIGYSFAAGNRRRMRSAVRISCLMGTALCLVTALLVYLRCGELIQIFTDDPDVVWLSTLILRASLMAMPVSALEAALITAFQAMGNAGALLALSVGKQLLLYIPLMVLAEHFLGLWGLVLLDPVKEYISSLLTLAFYLWIMRKR